jgi:cobalamin synthase
MADSRVGAAAVLAAAQLALLRAAGLLCLLESPGWQAAAALVAAVRSA